MTTTLSPTLWINEETARRRQAGAALVALGFGEAGLPVLPELAVRLAAAAGAVQYGPVAGIAPLRDAAAAYWARRGIAADPGLVVAGPGSKPLLFALLHALGGPVALPRPSWVSYAAQAALLGVRTVGVPIGAAGGVPDPDALAACAAQARAAGEPLRAVIVTLPDNPTGTLAGPATVRRLCAVAAEHELLVLSDEIYRDLVHDADAPVLSPAEVLPQQTVVTTGLSKQLALGGWRIGVARFPGSPVGRRLHGRVLTLASELWSAPAHPVQQVAAWALTEPEPVRERIVASRRLHGRVATAVAAQLERTGVVHRPPAAAFYLYPDFEPHRDVLAARAGITTAPQLAAALLDRHGIATLPGTAFGDDPRTLTLRLATSGLYGDPDQQLAALEHPDPARLGWIAQDLRTLGDALADLVGSA